jgi:hypothetical protein
MNPIYEFLELRLINKAEISRLMNLNIISSDDTSKKQYNRFYRAYEMQRLNKTEQSRIREIIKNLLSELIKINNEL